MLSRRSFLGGSVATLAAVSVIGAIEAVHAADDLVVGDLAAWPFTSPLPSGWAWCCGRYIDGDKYSDLADVMFPDSGNIGRFRLPDTSFWSMDWDFVNGRYSQSKTATDRSSSYIVYGGPQMDEEPTYFFYAGAGMHADPTLDVQKWARMMSI